MENIIFSWWEQHCVLAPVCKSIWQSVKSLTSSKLQTSLTSSSLSCGSKKESNVCPTRFLNLWQSPRLYQIRQRPFWWSLCSHSARFSSLCPSAVSFVNHTDKILYILMAPITWRRNTSISRKRKQKWIMRTNRAKFIEFRLSDFKISFFSVV